MNVLAILANVVFPGVGTLIVGKTGSGIIQLILYSVGLLLTFTFIGAIVGVPLCIGVWIWGLVSVLRP